jgi:hypothetical protein
MNARRFLPLLTTLIVGFAATASTAQASDLHFFHWRIDAYGGSGSCSLSGETRSCTGIQHDPNHIGHADPFTGTNTFGWTFPGSTSVCSQVPAARTHGFTEQVDIRHGGAQPSFFCGWTDHALSSPALIAGSTYVYIGGNRFRIWGDTGMDHPGRQGQALRIDVASHGSHDYSLLVWGYLHVRPA